jgi:hypothetical protein
MPWHRTTMRAQHGSSPRCARSVRGAEAPVPQPLRLRANPPSGKTISRGTCGQGRYILVGFRQQVRARHGRDFATPLLTQQGFKSLRNIVRGTSPNEDNGRATFNCGPQPRRHPGKRQSAPDASRRCSASRATLLAAARFSQECRAGRAPLSFQTVDP